MQEAYSTNIRSRIVGNLTTSFDMTGRPIDTYINGETVKILAGKVVVQGTDDNQALLPSAADQDKLGVVVKNHGDQRLTFGNNDGVGYDAGRAMAVITEGRVYVNCETACTKGSPVYVRHTVNGALVPGDVRNGTDTGTADIWDGSDGVTKAVFAETIAAAGIVEIEILRV